MFSVESIVYAWDNQLGYAQALLDDLTDRQMVLRPGGNMNHPAWILGHVSLYHPAVVGLLAGEAIDDPKDDPLFGFAGHGPLDDLTVYGDKQTIDLNVGLQPGEARRQAYMANVDARRKREVSAEVHDVDTEATD